MGKKKKNNYEEIRQEVAKSYKDKFIELEDKFKTACQIIDIKSNKIEELKSSINKLEAENEELKKLLDRSPEEIDKLLEYSSNMKVLASGIGCMSREIFRSGLL